jgi:hypothetical protein
MTLDDASRRYLAAQTPGRPATAGPDGAPQDKLIRPGPPESRAHAEAAEAMVRHGHSDLVGSWLDGYMRRLEESPRGLTPIGSGWQEALGDPRRVAGWTAFFRAETSERPGARYSMPGGRGCCRA